MTIPTYSDFQKQAVSPPPLPKADKSAWCRAVIQRFRDAQAAVAVTKMETRDTQVALLAVTIAKLEDYDAFLRGVAPQPRVKSPVEMVLELGVEKSRDGLADAIAKSAAPLVAAGINKRNRLIEKQNQELETVGLQLEEMSDELRGVKKEATDAIEDIRKGLAKSNEGIAKMLAQPAPGRGPMRTDARPNNDADTLRKAAAGAPPAVRDFLLNEAKAIDNDTTRRS